MGLALAVGMLADLLEADPEGAEHFEEQFKLVNKALAHAGLPAHTEPRELPNEVTFSCSMWGYSGLHYLRRIAAWDALGKGMPGPGDKDASKDSLVETYGQRALQTSSMPYAHLMLHSDAEGFYLPQPFDTVLFDDGNLGIAGAMIGSAPRLYAECNRLAALLGLPPELEPESDQVFEAVEAQGEAPSGWQRYGVESYSCLQLLRACEASQKSSAAIVFC